MSLNLVSVKCPECGASLDVEAGRTQIFCSYCGSKVIIENSNEYIYRHIDEANLKQAETERMIRLRELELIQSQSIQRSRQKRIFALIWIVLSIIILGIVIIKMVVLDDFENGFLMLFYLGSPVIGGGGYLIFKVIPEKEERKNMLEKGGIKIPGSIFPYHEKNNEMVMQLLVGAGFHKVSCVNLHDLKSDCSRKKGQVEDIFINGQQLVSTDTIVLPDSAIVVTYHGK